MYNTRYLIENIPVWEYNKIGIFLNWRDTMEYLTTSEIATKWNVSRRRVSMYCKDGRIKGAVLKGKTWLVPKNAEKPENPRHQKRHSEGE